MRTEQEDSLTSRLTFALQRRPQSAVGRYGAAIAVIVLAAIVRYFVHEHLQGSGFAIFFAATIVAAWLGGLGPCILAMVLSLVLSALFFTTDPTPDEDGIHVIVGLFAFAFCAIVVALLSDATHDAQDLANAQTEEAIRQREQLRTMLACIADAVIVTDQAGRVRMMNRAAEMLAACRAADVIGQPLSDSVQIRDAANGQPVESPVYCVLRENRPVARSIPLVLVATDGTKRPIDFTASPIPDSRGAAAGVVLIFRDETERQETERALREADRRKDDFLAVLAHELRNPLAPIGNALEILRIAGDDVELRQEAQVMMRRQFEHLVRLVDDLLDVSRIARGKIELRLEDVSIEDVIQRAIEAARPQIDAASHQFTVSLPDEAAYIHGDRVRLAQVVTNLLNNAARYTDVGGHIRLTVRCVASRLVLSVSDTGIGIAPEALPEIFGLFMQVDQKRGRVAPGLGIGLTLVRNIVEMHRGTVEARSDGLGRGSEFVISFPLVDAIPVPESISDSFPVFSDEPRKLLIVDDNVDAAVSLANLLRARKHQVQVAHNGPDALDCVDEHKPQIIFLDLGMPGMDGYQVAEQVRLGPGNGDVVLVALTGWGGPEDRKRTMAAGFDYHLVKPLRMEDLDSLITQPMRNPVLVDPSAQTAKDSFYFSH